MERLHARVQIIWLGFLVVVASVLAGIALAVDRFLTPIDVRLIAAGWIVVVVLAVVHTVLRYRQWRFELDGDSLFLVRGVVTRVDTSVPFVRVQHVDTQRRPWERALGLSSVVVFTAGSRGADITIPGLRPERATELRERLRDLAIESEGSDAV